MKEFINNVKGLVGQKFSSPEDRRFSIKQQAQLDLIEQYGGADKAGVWIDAYSRQFEELLNDTRYDLIDRLSDPETYPDALEDIKNILYPQTYEENIH